MRTRSRAVAGRGVTAALVLALLTSTQAAGPARAADDPDRLQALSLLGQVVSAFAPKAPRLGPAPLPRTDVGVLLRQLRVARTDLNPAERLLADQYLARPAAASAASSTCSGSLFAKALRSAHFCVRYSGGNDAQAQLTSRTLEDVYAHEVGRLGFRPPLSDGDGLLDVTLSQLGNQGIYGYCSTTSSAAQSPAYCELDNDFSVEEYGAPPINSLRVTAAHEFFHAIQFGYDADEAVWALEGTAVWAEDQVYPAINDYLQYLSFSPIVQPGTPIDSGGPFERYGIAVFWKFLAEYLGDPGVIRQVWRYADAPTGRSALQSVVAALAARGRAFGPTFARFASWNTLPAGGYADRLLYPAPRWALVRTLRPGSPGTGPRTAVLDHLSSAAYLIKPGPALRRNARLRVSVDGPARTTMPQALVQLRFRSGRVSYLTVPLDAAGNGSRLVTFDPRVVRSAVITLSNASTSGVDGQRSVLRARVVR